MNSKSKKLIRIRVSEEQYQALQDAREQTGSASIGDLALDTMRRLIEPPESESLAGNSSYRWTMELTTRLMSLQAEVERLETLLNVKR